MTAQELPDWPEYQRRRVERARNIIAERQRRDGLEGNTATILFHVLVDVVEMCDADGIDLDATIAQVRQYFVELEGCRPRS